MRKATLLFLRSTFSSCTWNTSMWLTADGTLHNDSCCQKSRARWFKHLTFIASVFTVWFTFLVHSALKLWPSEWLPLPSYISHVKIYLIFTIFTAQKQIHTLSYGLRPLVLVYKAQLIKLFHSCNDLDFWMSVIAQMTKHSITVMYTQVRQTFMRKHEFQRSVQFKSQYSC